MAAVTGNAKIAKNTIALYIRMGITMIISFFTARVTLQVLGVDNYGLNNLVGSIVAMFSFINGSMGTAVQRFYSVEIGKNNNERLGRIFGVGLYIHFIVALITLVIAEIFAVFFLSKLNIPEERLFAAQVVFQISAISLILNIINVPYAAFLRAKEEFSKMAVIEIIQAFLRLVVLYLLIKINYDKLIIYSLLNFGISLFYVVSIVIISRKYEATKFKIIRDKKLVKEMISFVSFLLFTVLASLLRDKGMVLLINLFFGLAINAAYAIANQIMSMVNSFAMNFKQSVVPQIMAEYGANNKDRMFRLIYSGTKITCLLLLIITIPVMFESEYLLRLWLKDVPEYTLQFTILVLINVNISSFTYFLYQAVHATGKIKFQQIAMSLLYMINIAIIYLTFKMNFNVYSALYVTISVSVLQCIVNVYFAKKLVGINIMYFFKQVVFKCFLSLIFIIIPLIIITNFISASLLRSFLVLITTIITGVCSGYIFVLNGDEKNALKNLIKKNHLPNLNYEFK